METRKETLSALKVCRFCLSNDEPLIPLYDNKARAAKKSVPFALKILACIAVEIFPSDNMPHYICQRCKLFMELSYVFKQLCRQTDEAILQFIQTGSPLTPMPWPAQLTKVYRAINKSNEANVVKTVVQGGATVKVMAEEVSDSEEGDDDNVYNVKIGDGSDEGKSIKVITTVDKNEQSGSKKDSEDADYIEVAQVQTGCWACDECECTYPLEQLLMLHKTQKHRERKETCLVCDRKFFSKHDLEMHHLTHLNELPYQCVACQKKFKRLILLKRHEKMMHSELPQQVCVHCPATFLSIEELKIHQEKHSVLRPFVCFICNKRFHDKHILQKHTELVHNKKSAFSCQYCPEQFPSVSKLTRHVREHAGVRSYPCKHCDKTFTKSHHHTRHLRMKHSETVRTAGPYNESEKYRCDECDDTFTTQDELMYHSALHATRNLICPLCQEKFDDVDTVTAHIKSHVNGTEFMCDFCELIFTTKEKLESHIACAHDDELLANDQETENDESSMDMDAEEAEDDDDNSINVKEVDGHMVVEIKKAGEYMLPTIATAQNVEKYGAKIMVKSVDDDVDMTYTDSPMTEVETTPTPQQLVVPFTKEVSISKIQDTTPKEGTIVIKAPQATEVSIGPNSSSILRKAEEIKRKAAVIQQQASVADKKEKTKMESNSAAATGASDKSLRLLEKELQDLKRTNTRVDAAKTPIRTVESLRNRRPQLFSSTPKIRTLDKKEAVATKPALEKVVATEKKQLERKITKDTKEPKDAKIVNNNVKEDKELKGNGKEEKEVRGNSKEEKEVRGNSKEDKEVKGNSKEDKEVRGNSKEDKEIKGNNKEDKEVKGEKEVTKEEKKEAKEKEIPKMIVKNGGAESAAPVEETVRRSTRPSKVKDYAKMIRDSSLNSDDNDTDAEDNDFENYKEQEKTPEATRARGRRGSVKQPPTATPAKALSGPAATAAKAATPTSAPRKRGRPRKGQTPVVPNKIKKDDRSDEEADQEMTRAETSTPRASPPKEDTPYEPENAIDGNKTPDANKLPHDPRPGVIISPSGQTLKKVPIKALPPGVKPLPLPVNSRLGGGEVTEMQIGKKIVKVQKIVMTKAEVEAMTKKGLLEIKDGTMVLKPGIKLPAADPAALKSTLVGDAERKKESLTKLDKAAPTRCNLDA